MADGVPITAGSGTTIATDDAGAAGHVQVVKLAVSTDGSATALTADNTDGLLVNLGSNNDVTVTSISAGDNNIGNVDVVTLPALAAGTNNIGDVDVLTVPANAGTATSTINSTSSDGGTALTSTAQAIKGSAGVLYGYYIYNPNSTAQYVQFYNTAQGSVTVGTTNPLFMLTIPPATAANLWMQPGGITFGTAMSWAATSTAGGNGAPTTALDAVCWYA